MADDDTDSSGDRVAKEWPLQGHVIVPGSGLEVRRDCLGQSFWSRVRHSTRSYDFRIELPRPGRDFDDELTEPMWDFTPDYESELHAERSTIRWGEAITFLDHAYVFRCGYYAELPASDAGEADTVWDEFNSEFKFWWEAFTSWAAILASQDLVGPPEWAWSGPDMEGWLMDPHEQPAGFKTRTILKTDSPTHRVLELQDLQACVTAAGNQGLPPVEWLFIRDARSWLNAGEYRRALIDAGSAAELAMTELIDKYLDDANALEPVRKALKNSSNNLGGKKQMLNLLRPGLLHDRVEEGLIKKRNGAAHKNEEYTQEVTRAALDIAITIVESAYPLASYLGGSPAPHSA